MKRKTPQDMVNKKAEELADVMFTIIDPQPLEVTEDFSSVRKATIVFNLETMQDVFALKGKKYLKEQLGQCFINYFDNLK